MRRISVITIGLALLAGGAAAWWGLPWLRLHHAIEAVGSPDPERRAAAWQLLTAPRDGRPPAAAEHLERLDRRLLDAGDAAVLDAGVALRPLDLWSWATRPTELVLRELGVRVGGGDDDRRLVIEALRTAPLDLDPDAFAPLVEPILDDGSDLAIAAWQAAASWAGPGRARWLGQLAIPTDAPALHRRRHLTLGAAEHPSRVDVDAWLAWPAPVAEAVLLRHVLARPDDPGPVLEAAARWPAGGRRPAFAAVLRYAEGPDVDATLERWADEGDRAALFALQARSPQREQTAARDVAERRGEPPWRRRLAAWRWPDVPASLAREILALDPVDPGGHVYAASLLAERVLPRDEAATLASTWIRDLDDDRKRAGAVLAAVLGEPVDLLATARDAEDVAAVRTIQHLALWALDATPAGPDPLELAHRARHAADGAVDPDVIACRLVAGDRTALPALTSPPAGERSDAGHAAQARSWLVERFAPRWHGRFGRPIGAGLDELELHADTLDAWSTLAERRLLYDPRSRTYDVAPRP